jgi:hemolysin activation/secretion protein
MWPVIGRAASGRVGVCEGERVVWGCSRSFRGGGAVLRRQSLRSTTTVCLLIASAAAFNCGSALATASSESAKPSTASPVASAAPSQTPLPQGAAPPARFEIDEYRVEGADALAQIDVEEAVYPFLGPDRSSADVEKARAALEKTYHDKGYQTVSVAVPPQQDPSRGFVVLKVSELKVGRLWVKSARYFDLDKIKDKAPSLKEGTLPNFDAVTRDIVALNQWPDRRVTPAIRAGVAPGTVDVDLNVDDTLPLHGSLELNNRQSPNTTALRSVATLHYDNLWQLGQSLTLSYQIAPDRPQDSEVFSASYLAPLLWFNNLSLLVYGVDTKSDVSTVGGTSIVGPGQILGERLVITLPTRGNYFHTLSFGLDYKHFDQDVSLAGSSGYSSPITYYPLVTTYGATLRQDATLAQFNATITEGLRGLGSSPTAWDNKRYDATASFIALKSDLSLTWDLPQGFQLFAKAQGQIADQPLISSEEFSLGGLDTVRGYRETETLGDDGVAGTLELRTPNLAALAQRPAEAGQPQPRSLLDEWRLFAFADAGAAGVIDPLPGQEARFGLWSWGGGTRFKMLDHLNGMVAISTPMVSQADTPAREPRVDFRVWSEF